MADHTSFLDMFLGWFVIAIPFLVTVGAAVLALRLPNQRHYWKIVWGSIAIGLAFSAIAAWQQRRAVEQAATDRDNAISNTADRVAKQTTENVAKSLAQQYGSTIKAMVDQLTEQGKKVETIGQSAIVTGKRPVAVVVTNPTPTSSGTPVPEIHVAKLSVAANPKYGKNAVQFILTTNTVMNGGRVVVTCTKGKINQGSEDIPGADVMLSGGGGVQDEHTYASGISSPNWSPDFPLLITLYYDSEDLGICSFRPLK